ncbi:hypothetical protein L2E82_47676 [Cichorium intybus]|uniref:Uncharacterized protein n=1 Tax=Cichorium intybus TaxID=13427 RepID=A0ACB8Z0C0_CICIN|nr:hypothetical protein L2E82_47676 [Cichorium intybus]
MEYKTSQTKSHLPSTSGAPPPRVLFLINSYSSLPPNSKVGVSPEFTFHPIDFQAPVYPYTFQPSPDDFPRDRSTIFSTSIEQYCNLSNAGICLNHGVFLMRC